MGGKGGVGVNGQWEGGSCVRLGAVVTGGGVVGRRHHWPRGRGVWGRQEVGGRRRTPSASPLHGWVWGVVVLPLLLGWCGVLLHRGVDGCPRGEVLWCVVGCGGEGRGGRLIG